MSEVSTEAATTATLALVTALMNTLVKNKTMTSEEVGDTILAAGSALQDGGNAEAIDVLSALLRDHKTGF